MLSSPSLCMALILLFHRDDGERGGVWGISESRKKKQLFFVVVAMADHYAIFFFPTVLIKRRRQSKKVEVYPENKASISTIVSGKLFPEKRN